MKSFNPYLNFPGNTEEAFVFYRSVFGGEFLNVTRFADTPEAHRVPADEKDKIMYIALPIGKKNILMGTDALESMGHQLTTGNHISLNIDTESEDEARRLIQALAANGGRITIPLEKTSWAMLFGMCTDAFGIKWMINFDSKVQ